MLRMPAYNHRLNRQFGSGLAQSIFGFVVGETVNLKNHPTGFNFKGIALRVAFALAHTHFSRFGRVRTVRKNSYPDLACFLYHSSYGFPRRFKLISFYSPLGNSFQPMGAKRNMGASGGHSFFGEIAPVGLPFSEFYFFGKHVR